MLDRKDGSQLKKNVFVVRSLNVSATIERTALTSACFYVGYCKMHSSKIPLNIVYQNLSAMPRVAHLWMTFCFILRRCKHADIGTVIESSY